MLRIESATYLVALGWVLRSPLSCVRDGVFRLASFLDLRVLFHRRRDSWTLTGRTLDGLGVAALPYYRSSPFRKRKSLAQRKYQDSSGIEELFLD